MLPTFPNPDTFRRNVVAGPIPCPTLITESVFAVDLQPSDKIVYADEIFTLSNHDSDRGESVFYLGEWTSKQGYARLPISSRIDKVTAVTFGLLSQSIPLEWLRDDSICYYGKFANQLEAYCWETALEESHNSIGHCDELGWCATRVDITLRHGNIYPLATDSVVSQWRDVIGLDYPAGYIVTEDDRGAVDVSFFDTVEELETEWSRLQEIESEHYANEEDDQ